MNMLDKLTNKYIPEPNSGCWLWIGGVQAEGYGLIRDGIKRAKAHRVSYKLFKGNIPAGLVVRHICDTPECINPDHLVLGTHKDNSDDRVKRNRQSKGSSVHSAKLKESDIPSIRIKLETRTIRDVAKEYKVHHSAIDGIKQRKTWKHI